MFRGWLIRVPHRGGTRVSVHISPRIPAGLMRCAMGTVVSTVPRSLPSHHPLPAWTVDRMILAWNLRTVPSGAQAEQPCRLPPAQQGQAT
jgi:hypothetical protein